MNNDTITQNEIAIHEYAMNAASIAADWVSYDMYSEMYETYKDQYAGFVGIINIATDAALAFTVEAASYTPGEDYYWIEAIECFAFQTFSYLTCGEVPTESDFHLIAAGCIEKCKVK